MTMPDTLKPDELLPCPFCGSAAEVTERGAGVVHISCTDWKGCGMFPQHKGPAAETYAAWNRRAPTTAEASLVKAREALTAFVNVRDQFPESAKLIQPAHDEFSPISVTVTKGQFLAARLALSNGEKDNGR